MRLSPRCAELLLARGATVPGGEVATLTAKRSGHELGYKEPSLAYYLGGRLRVLDAALLDEPSDCWPYWLVMTEEIWDDSPIAARSRLDRVATLRGVNYNAGGGETSLIVARTKADIPTVDGREGQASSRR
jgi:hypothetical protein